MPAQKSHGSSVRRSRRPQNAPLAASCRCPYARSSPLRTTNSGTETRDIRLRPEYRLAALELAWEGQGAQWMMMTRIVATALTRSACPRRARDGSPVGPRSRPVPSANGRSPTRAALLAGVAEPKGWGALASARSRKSRSLAHSEASTARTVSGPFRSSEITLFQVEEAGRHGRRWRLDLAHFTESHCSPLAVKRAVKPRPRARCPADAGSSADVAASMLLKIK